MRLPTAAAAAAIFCTAISPADDAAAFDRVRAPAGHGAPQTVHHYVYAPHYRHVYHAAPSPDPYAYRYEPRGYYPYYGTAYWKPAHMVRRAPSVKLPPYYQAWGYPRPWHNRSWHHQHHGRHFPWHW